MPVSTPIWDRQQFLAALNKFMPPSDPRAIVFRTAPPERCARQGVFTLGLQHVANGSGIQAAAPAGWRHLAAVSDLAVAAHGRKETITSLTDGPRVHPAVTTLAAVQGWGTAQQKHYEIATLRIPGARVEAYWLRYLNGNEADDYIWPFLTLNRTLQSKRIWRVTDFLEAVKAVAQTDLAFYKTDLPVSIPANRSRTGVPPASIPGRHQ